MRPYGPLFLLAFSLCACSGETDGEANNVAADGRGAATSPAGDGSGEGGGGSAGGGDGAPPPAGEVPREPPADNGEAPEPSREVTLSVAPARTSAGATMTITLRNGAREPVGYNLCTSAIETSAGRDVPTGRICTMELRTLQPGRSADHGYELPGDLPDGRYRFLTQIEWMESGRRNGVRSPEFEVR